MASTIFSHGAELKAFWMSSVRMSVLTFRSLSFSVVIRRLTASVVDLPARKPN